MSESIPKDEEFENLIARVREGDAEAARQCVQAFEPEIRRAVRMRLTDPRLRQFVDSVDICQSVFGKFFISAADDQLEIERPEQMLGLLITMARHRVIDLARRQYAKRRDVERNERIDGNSSGPMQLAGQARNPLSVVIGNELVNEIKQRLSPAELEIAEQRLSGQPWQEIADRFGEQVDAVRKRYDRAMLRVRKELLGDAE